jgi:predicted nucleic acid-binding protein
LSCAFIPQGSRFQTKQLDTGPATQIVIQINSGILLSHDQQQELLCQAVLAFFDQNAAQLITSPICIAEVLWLLGNPSDPRVLAAQNHLLGAVSRGGIEVSNLLPEDYSRIAELNQRYADLPGDFADLTLVTLSERLDVAEILSLDSDFDIYRRFRREPFRRVSLP